MSRGRALRDGVEELRIVDTHEHLLSDRLRAAGPGIHDMLPCADAALLLHHYCRDDLTVAGLAPHAAAELFSPDVAPDVKWRIVEPALAAVGHTGYVEAVRRSAALVFDEPRLDRDSFMRISERMLDPTHVRQGLNARMLDAAGVASCQVQSLEAFCFDAERSGEGGVLQDLWVDPLTTRLDLDVVERALGERPRDLATMEALVDGIFATWGREAIAVKTLAAYTRPLDIDEPSRAAAEHAFSRLAAGTADAGHRRVVENALLHHCFTRAAEADLPVKVHCGLTAGIAGIGLRSIRDHAVDIERVLVAHPETTFVLMHMGWPYQDEYIALAKHHPNVIVDMAWTWIVNPQAAMRFVREFVLCAPARSLLGFGGDYTIAECVAGHADMARQGIASALGSLVDDGWIDLDAARALAPRLLRDNAVRVFGERVVSEPRTSRESGTSAPRGGEGSAAP